MNNKNSGPASMRDELNSKLRYSRAKSAARVETNRREYKKFVRKDSASRSRENLLGFILFIVVILVAALLAWSTDVL